MIDSQIKNTRNSYTVRPKITEGATAAETLADWVANGIKCDLIANPDGFDVMGTEIAKWSLIDDETAGMYELDPTTATPNQALAIAAIGVDRAYVIVDVGWPDIQINGITNADGSPVVSNTDGIATGYSFGTSTTLSTQSYPWCPSVSKTISTPLGKMTNVDLIVTPVSDVFEYTTSAVLDLEIPRYMTVHIALLGGGYKGNTRYYFSGYYVNFEATGGLGGKLLTQVFQSGEKRLIESVVIAASGDGNATMMVTGEATYSSASGTHTGVGAVAGETPPISSIAPVVPREGSGGIMLTSPFPSATVGGGGQAVATGSQTMPAGENTVNGRGLGGTTQALGSSSTGHPDGSRVISDGSAGMAWVALVPDDSWRN